MAAEPAEAAVVFGSGVCFVSLRNKCLSYMCGVAKDQWLNVLFVCRCGQTAETRFVLDLVRPSRFVLTWFVRTWFIRDLFRIRV